MSLNNSRGPKIVIAPEEYLEFIVDPEESTSESTLAIFNNADQTIAYKIKSSSPKDFLIADYEGIIEPRCKTSIEILYKVSTESYLKFHKFLLQTVAVQDGENPNWKASGVHEYKLCARLSTKKYVVVGDKVVVEEQKVDREVEEEKSKLNQSSGKFDLSSAKIEGREEEEEEVVEVRERPKGVISKVMKKQFNLVHIVIAFIIGYMISYFAYSRNNNL